MTVLDRLLGFNGCLLRDPLTFVSYHLWVIGRRLLDRIRVYTQVYNTVTKRLLSNPRQRRHKTCWNTSTNGYGSKHLFKFMTRYPRIII